MPQDRITPASLLLLLFGVAVLPVALPAQVEAAEAVRKTGRHFVLHCHGGDEDLAQRALDAVEPVWPIVAAAFGQQGRRPAQPLAVHLYRTTAGYEVAERALTNGKFQRNLAMSHWDSKSAHVALQPPCTDETLRAIGLPALTIELLAWEACHLARFELCANFRDHPMWLVDGLASSVGRQVLESLRPSGSGVGATAATDLAILQRMQREKRMPKAGAILADRIDELGFTERYAARAVFFQCLSGKAFAERLQPVLGVVRSTGGGEQYGKVVLAAARKAFGASLDKDFDAFVKDQRPQWCESFRSLALLGATWQQVAFPEKNAIAWRTEPVRGGGIGIGGRLRILPGGQQQMNVLIGEGPAADFWSVAFVADVGFTLFAYENRTDTWRELGKGSMPGLRLGYESTFAVEVKGKRMRVVLDGQHWDFNLDRPLPAAPLWAVGVQAGAAGGATGSAGLWVDVAARPARD